MRSALAVRVVLAATLAVAALNPETALATEYRFTVTCGQGFSLAHSHVVLWKTGDIDPGREWLRVATGTGYPDCSVSHYDPATDAGLRIETRSHESAVVKGIPVLGPILCAIFKC